MANTDCTATPVFSPHLRMFVTRCCPDALGEAELDLVEAGVILLHKWAEVRRLDALAAQWLELCEVFRSAWRSEVTPGVDIGEEAWYFLRARMGMLAEDERASLEALRVAAGEPAEQCS